MSTEPDPSKVLTRSLIEATADDDLETTLLNYVTALQSQAPDRLDTLPAACQAHFIAFLRDGEVLNGGFNQFWFNSPDFAQDAAVALEFFEMPEASQLARKAAELYETVRPRHDAARSDGTIEAFLATYEGQPFQALDDAYSSRESEWREARIRYIRRHVESFVHV